MDQERVARSDMEATPIFGAYRRGYDPDQVDRYVSDQQRRLDEASHRASEAERKLGAAIGQLRELHRRVAVLESQERPYQAPALDALGDRVQRILNEAWEGAYSLRQAAEQDVLELRNRAETEAAEIVSSAELRAIETEEESIRRRDAQRSELEQELAKAVSQISYLHEQKKLLLTDLLRLRDVISATVTEHAPQVTRRSRPQRNLDQIHQTPISEHNSGVFDAADPNATSRASIEGVSDSVNYENEQLGQEADTSTGNVETRSSSGTNNDPASYESAAIDDRDRHLPSGRSEALSDRRFDLRSSKQDSQVSASATQPDDAVATQSDNQQSTSKPYGGEPLLTMEVTRVQPMAQDNPPRNMDISALVREHRAVVARQAAEMAGVQEKRSTLLGRNRSSNQGSDTEASGSNYKAADDPNRRRQSSLYDFEAD